MSLAGRATTTRSCHALIVVAGSITLCQRLIERGLVDKYRLFVYLVVQGRGCPLFLDGFECPS